MGTQSDAARLTLGVAGSAGSTFSSCGRSSYTTKRPVSGLQPAASQEEPQIIIVHPSRLFRDCLVRSLGDAEKYSVLEFAQLDDISQGQLSAGTALVLIGFSDDGQVSHEQQLEAVLEAIDDRTALVVTGTNEEADYVAGLLRKGVKGYIPASLGLDVSIQALRLVLVGGTFIPASCLMNLQPAQRRSGKKANDLEKMTAKQLAVIEAIRRGKANKTIAYELNMCESTVKVHVRNIMKKLNAKNRTQVAFIANELLKTTETRL